MTSDSTEALRTVIAHGDHQQARAILSELLANHPSAEILYLASQVALSEEQRLRFLYRAVALDPSHTAAQAALRAADPANDEAAAPTRKRITQPLSVDDLPATPPTEQLATPVAPQPSVLASAPASRPAWQQPRSLIWAGVVLVCVILIGVVATRPRLPSDVRRAAESAISQHTGSETMQLVYAQQRGDSDSYCATFRVDETDYSLIAEARSDTSVHIVGQYTDGQWNTMCARERQGQALPHDSYTYQLASNELATSTPVPTATPTMTPTPSATPTPLPTPTLQPVIASLPTTVPIRSVTSGEITMVAGDTIALVRDTTQVSDFVTRVSFTNPTIKDNGLWDVGFIFRSSDNNNDLRFILLSDQRWQLRYSNTGEPLATGELTFDTTPGTEHTLELIAADEYGWVFLDGEFAAELPLRALIDTGEVKFGSGFFKDTTYPGVDVKYRNWTIYPITTASDVMSGQLQRPAADKIALYDASETAGRDLAMFTTFTTPSAEQWNYGYIMRLSDDAHYRLVMMHDSTWHLMLRRQSNDTLLQEGTWNPDTTAGNKNRIQVLALGSRGWLIANRQVVGELDLSALQVNGWSFLAAQFYEDTLATDKGIAFENARIIALPIR